MDPPGLQHCSSTRNVTTTHVRVKFKHSASMYSWFSKAVNTGYKLLWLSRLYSAEGKHRFIFHPQKARNIKLGQLSYCNINRFILSTDQITILSSEILPTQIYSKIDFRKRKQDNIWLYTSPVNAEKHLLLWHPNQWCPECCGRSRLRLWSLRHTAVKLTGEHVPVNKHSRWAGNGHTAELPSTDSICNKLPVPISSI